MLSFSWIVCGGTIAVPTIKGELLNQLAWERTDIAQCEVSFIESEVFSIGLRNSSDEEIPVQIIKEERYSEG